MTLLGFLLLAGFFLPFWSIGACLGFVAVHRPPGPLQWVMLTAVAALSVAPFFLLVLLVGDDGLGGLWLFILDPLLVAVATLTFAFTVMWHTNRRMMSGPRRNENELR